MSPLDTEYYDKAFLAWCGWLPVIVVEGQWVPTIFMEVHREIVQSHHQ